MSEILAAGIVLILLVIIRIFLEFIAPVSNLEFGVASTSGDREIQADRFDYARTDAGFMLALADGIGYGEKGKIAASVAVDVCRIQFEQLKYFDNPGFFFQKTFLMANHDIMEVIDSGTAGANLLCAVVANGKLYYALARISMF